MENKNATAAKKASLVRVVGNKSPRFSALVAVQSFHAKGPVHFQCSRYSEGILYNGVAQNKILLPIILHALLRFKHCSSKVTFLEKRRLLFLYKIVST